MELHRLDGSVPRARNRVVSAAATHSTRTMTASPAIDEWSVRKAPHPDIQDEAEARERRDEGRPAVAHERQRDPLDRREAGRQRDAVKQLKRKTSDDPSHQVHAQT